MAPRDIDSWPNCLRYCQQRLRARFGESRLMYLRASLFDHPRSVLVVYCSRSQGYNLTLRLTPKEQKALLRVVGSRGQDALSLRFYQLWWFDPASHNWMPDPHAYKKVGEHAKMVFSPGFE